MAGLLFRFAGSFFGLSTAVGENNLAFLQRQPSLQ
jgi:hypothetical protein